MSKPYLTLDNDDRPYESDFEPISGTGDCGVEFFDDGDHVIVRVYYDSEVMGQRWRVPKDRLIK